MPAKPDYVYDALTKIPQSGDLGELVGWEGEAPIFSPDGSRAALPDEFGDGKWEVFKRVNPEGAFQEEDTHWHNKDGWALRHHDGKLFARDNSRLSTELRDQFMNDPAYRGWTPPGEVIDGDVDATPNGIGRAPLVLEELVDAGGEGQAEPGRPSDSPAPGGPERLTTTSSPSTMTPSSGFEALSGEDQARVAKFVEVLGWRIMANPATASTSNVGRYVRDSDPMRPLVDWYGGRTVWDAAQQYAEAHPSVLEEPGSVQALQERNARVEEIIGRAAEDLDDLDALHGHLSEAALVDPDYTEGDMPHGSIERFRDEVARQIRDRNEQQVAPAAELRAPEPVQDVQEVSAEQAAPPRASLDEAPPAQPAARLQIASMDDLAPSGQRARAEANLSALAVLRSLQDQGRAASDAERQVLARWSAWGALPQIFDETKADWAELRTRLTNELSPEEFAAARRTTINAHYTDPAYVRPMWDTLARLGFTEGQVLEPGSGIGTFIGMAPDGARMTGVELDPVTAAMSQAIYPQASVRAESFAATRLPAGYFDASVGNVPFADVALHDPTHNRGGHAIHNHFIIKSLHLVRPGGMAAFLTSRYTMDAANPAARREMNGLADLVGAVRLPTGAHRRAAGTDVVTDLLVFRRREPGTEPRDDLWESVTAHKIGDEIVRTNSYFHAPEHQDKVLGTYDVGHGMYGEATLNVRGDITTTAGRLTTVLDGIVEHAQREGLTLTERTEQAQVPAGRVAEAGEGLWEGHLTAQEDGTFTALHTGQHEPMTVPRTQAGELRTLLRLRDQARDLLTLEAATAEDTQEIATARQALARTYQGYQAAHGPLNRFTTRRTGKTHPETGEDITARVVPPVMRTLRSDPFAALVMALENFDDATGTATPAALLTQRVVLPRTPVLGADTPDEALALSVEQHGRVDLEHIAYLLGTTEQDARAQLGALVFDDPGTESLQPAAEYLSGNIADKLDAARAAAASDDAFGVNVTALENVLPTPLGMDEVEPRIGAVWIDPATHAQFLSELLDAPVKVHHPGANMWEVDGPAYGVKAVSEWGTEKCPAPEVFEHALRQRPIRVTMEVDGTYVLNPEATEAAREKLDAMQERFAEWVWEDPERGNRLLADYNRRFNSLVLRDYTAEGAALSLPGLAKDFVPRAHQRTAVARMIAEPAVGLFHEVGAGKTAEMVMGAMELKRLGMVTKPAVVIPNHMLEQFSREWLQLYPQARILAASSKDLTGDKRRLFVARVATGDWDAVIMTRGAFERLPVAPEVETAYIETQVDEIRTMLSAARDSGAKSSVKKIEKALARHEERMAARLDGPQEHGITFEETGIDYLVIDEAHEYKNLATISEIPDASIEGSKRASDLHMKLEGLRERHGDRVATLATATPIANSVTEAHVMQRYLRPDLLQAAGVLHFDRWAATFGQTVTEIEMGVAGGYKMKSRFAKFQNVPEMLKMWHVFADVKTAEDLNLPTPELAMRPDGVRGAQNMVLEPPEELVAYVGRLAARTDLIQARAVTPSEDNMLKVSSDGRAAALDLRLVGHARTPGNKLEAAAARIAAIWRNNADNVYTDPASGQPSAVTGALQIVFSDLGTPHDGEWSAYEELRGQLVRHGMPRASIRFIHEAKNDAQKGALFSACRSGEVSVIIGSTQKMGVGTNIQARAVALHHLDCPWRPADVQQRDGRILRQGNQNPEISIHRWVVEKSFDAYSWQTVERKQKFIAQIMRGKLDVREIEDIGDAAMSFAEVKALASGDPLIIEKEKASNEVAKLERLERAHHRNLIGLQRSLAGANEGLDRATTHLPALEAAAAKVVPTAGDAFSVTLPGGDRTTSRTEAGEQLHAWITSKSTTIISAGRSTSFDDVPLGTAAQLGGHSITAAAVPRTLTREGYPTVRFAVDGAPRTSWTVLLDDVQPGPGLVRQFENHVADLPKVLADVEAEIPRHQRTIDQATEALDRPFKHADALTTARARLDEIELQMNPPAEAPPTEQGIDPGLAATRMRAGIGTGAPAAQAVVGAGESSKAPTASVDRGHEQEPVVAPVIDR
jgi:N12 class adenine-specific DNA methylase